MKMCIILVVILIGFAIILLNADISAARSYPDTVLACWLFDEGEGDTAGDDTGNGWDAEIIGPVWVDGLFEKALEFDGVDDIVIVTGSEDENLVTFTLEAWIKIENFNGSFNDIITKQTPKNIMMNVQQGTGLVANAFFLNGANQIVRGSTPVTDGEWHYIVSTYDGEKLRVFVDGELDGELAIAAEPDKGDGPITIGRNFGGASPALGIIDTVCVRNVALTPDEVMAEHKRAFAVDPAEKLTATWGRVKLLTYH